MKDQKLALEFCRGSGEGMAIYLSDNTGGKRLFGNKCWGLVKTVKSFPLTLDNIDNAILELKKAKKIIKKQERKNAELEECSKCEGAGYDEDSEGSPACSKCNGKGVC